MVNPAFTTLLSTEDKIILLVSSADNADSGLYTVGFEAVFEGGKATKLCSVDLDIEKAIYFSFDSSM